MKTYSVVRNNKQQQQQQMQQQARKHKQNYFQFPCVGESKLLQFGGGGGTHAYAVEDTPIEMSRSTSLSNITIESEKFDQLNQHDQSDQPSCQLNQLDH